jgi:hypothetical protein
MSVNMGKAMKVVKGNEVEYDITCCMRTKSDIDEMFKLRNMMNELHNYFNPTYYRYMKIKTISTEKGWDMNYCPHCGDKL